ncbi:MAG: response regulator transcription factor [Candidatus Omnitrophota bacterium]
MAKRILIIEDDHDIVSLLGYRLKQHGYDVLSAHDGEAGLHTAQNDSPDLIILDLNLPVLNGFTICSMLKSNPEYQNIPIIMLTARDGYADNIFDDKVRPEAYFTKPFEVDELLAKIEELLKAAPAQE